MIASVTSTRIRRFLCKTAFMFLAVYAMIIVALAFLETRLVYPGAYLKTVPLDKRMSTVPIEYTTSDGNKIEGRLLKRKGCSNYLLFMHGNLSKAQRLDDLAKRLSMVFDATVLLAEYRGYEDDITPTEIGLVHDCEAARDYLCENFGIQQSEIILYGRSLGGGCAVTLAANGGAKALILERTYDELLGIASRQYPWVPVRLIMRNRFNPVKKIKDYQGPIVIIHGTADELIPIECSQRLFEAANSEQKKLIKVKGLGHNGVLPSECLQEIVDTVDLFSSHPQ